MTATIAVVSCAVDLPSDPAAGTLDIAMFVPTMPASRPEILVTLDDWLDVDASRVQDAIVVSAGSARASLEVTYSVVDRTLVARPWTPLRPELMWEVRIEGDALVALDGGRAADLAPEPLVVAADEVDVAPVTPPPTWDEDVGPLLQARCAPCHTDGGPLLQLTREALVDRPAAMDETARLVLPRAPARSTLLLLVVPGYSDRPGTTMPPPWSEQPPLDATELRLLETWIRGGAR